jgi:predicted RNA-binding Zn-ribbon protein involved in translation (DUF1610 family)
MDEHQRCRGFQYCPKCKVKIYLNTRLYFECPVCGKEYKLNYATGKLEEVFKPR